MYICIYVCIHVNIIIIISLESIEKVNRSIYLVGFHVEEGYKHINIT
jgi:hypothetical protein